MTRQCEIIQFPVNLKPAEEGGYIVTFPDVPEAITQGDNEVEALMAARDALETALEMYVSAREDLPTPSDPRGGTVVDYIRAHDYS